MSIFDDPFFRNKPALKSLETIQEPKPDHVRACLMEMSRFLIKNARSLIENENKEIRELIVNLMENDRRPWQEKAAALGKIFHESGKTAVLEEFCSWFHNDEYTGN